MALSNSRRTSSPSAIAEATSSVPALMAGFAIGTRNPPPRSRPSPATRPAIPNLFSPTMAALRHILPGHNAITHSLGFSRNSKLLASSGDNRQARVWDLETGKRQWSSPEGIDEATLLLFSSDGNTLLSANSDTDLRIWRTRNGELTRKIVDYAMSLFAADYSADGQWLAMAGTDRSIYVWDARSSKLIRTFTGHPDLIAALAFAPNGKSFLTIGQNEGGSRYLVNLRSWDLASGRLAPDRTLTPHHGQTCYLSRRLLGRLHL